MGSNLRIMDDAFEYLLPTEAKKKERPVFHPPPCGRDVRAHAQSEAQRICHGPGLWSAGFLLHAMDWCYPADDNDKREMRKHKYAAKYLWGIDFETRAAKTPGP